MSPATLRRPSLTAAACTVKQDLSCSLLYTGLCRHSDRVESAYSAMCLNLVTVLARNEVRLIKGAKRAVCVTFPNR